MKLETPLYSKHLVRTRDGLYLLFEAFIKIQISFLKFRKNRKLTEILVHDMKLLTLFSTRKIRYFTFVYLDCTTSSSKHQISQV